MLISVRSFFQEDSYGDLQVDRDGLEGVLRLHNVAPDFLTILAAAGQPPLDSEEGFGHPIARTFEANEYGDANLLCSD